MTDLTRTGLGEWLSPPTLLTVIAIVGTIYAAFVLHRERLERLEARIAVVEQDTQRKDVAREQLEAMRQRLTALERK